MVVKRNISQFSVINEWNNIKVGPITQTGTNLFSIFNYISSKVSKTYPFSQNLQRPDSRTLCCDIAMKYLKTFIYSLSLIIEIS